MFARDVANPTAWHGALNGALIARRALAVLCAVALLLVAFTHNVRHSVDAAPVATLTWQTDVLQTGALQTGASQTDLVFADDAGVPSSKHDPAVVEHCHGCTMVAALTSIKSAPPLPIAVTLARADVASVHPHQPSADTPPPRTAN
jgi:hypothetical protein